MTGYEKQVSWQFAEGYYKDILIPQINRIITYINNSLYLQAHNELRQIFAQISEQIRYYDKTTQKKKEEEREDNYNNLLEETKEITQLVFKYNTLLLKEPNPRLLITINKLKEEVDSRVMEYYRNIFSMMDKLNMLFPKKKFDTDLPIYQQ